MPRIADVIDPDLRAGLTAAEQALDEGDNTATVQRAVETYCKLVARRPDLVIPFLDRRGTFPGPGEGLASLRSAAGPAWPDLGVGMTRGDDGQPQFEWRKQRFSMSEATVYLEYVLTLVVHAQQTQRAS
jgi:hypothetical protein